MIRLEESIIMRIRNHYPLLSWLTWIICQVVMNLKCHYQKILVKTYWLNQWSLVRMTTKWNHCLRLEKWILMTFLLDSSQMLISDMIVWWRALAIWPRNRLVWCIGIILVVTTGGRYSMLKLSFVGYSWLIHSSGDCYHVPELPTRLLNCTTLWWC